MRILIILSITLVALMVGCTNDSDATRILSQQGYADIRMTGYQLFACSQDDFYHTGFVAKTPANVDVEGCVCSGLLFKNSTIRFK